MYDTPPHTTVPSTTDLIETTTTTGPTSTSPPTTVIVSSTTSSTTTSVTYTVRDPANGQLIVPNSPMEDPRVNWIHTLRKPVLTSTMAKHGLDTTGSVEELRRRFCAYWTDPTTIRDLTSMELEMIAAQEDNRMASYAPSSHTGGHAPSDPYGQGIVGEVKRMLRISPNADDTTVRRTLATVLMRSPTSRAYLSGDQLDEGEFHTQAKLDNPLSFSTSTTDVPRSARPTTVSFSLPVCTTQVPLQQTTQPRQIEPIHSAGQHTTSWGEFYPARPAMMGATSERWGAQPQHTSHAQPQHLVGYQPLPHWGGQPQYGSGISSTLDTAYAQFPGRPMTLRTEEVYSRQPMPQWGGQPQYACQPSYQAVRHTAQTSAPQPRLPMTMTTEGYLGSGQHREVHSMCDLVRKWNLRFDGRRDPVSFLERLEELVEAYCLSPDEVLSAMPELLHGQALLWYRNCKDMWHSFADFRRYFEAQFLPPGYQRNLDEEVRKRTQGEHESFRDFVIAITTLVRRSGNFSAQQRVDLIYANMRPEYKFVIRRQDFFSLSELAQRAEEYESLMREQRSFRPPPHPSLALVPEVAYASRRKPERMDVAVVEDISPYNPASEATGQTNPSFRKGDKRESAKVTHCPTTPTRREKEAVGVQSRPPNRNSPPPDAVSKKNPRPTVCWNCDVTGHLFRDCPEPKVLRCFYCKKKGIATTICKCRSGNGRRTQQTGGRLSPTPQIDERPPKSGISGSKR